MAVGGFFFDFECILTRCGSRGRLLGAGSAAAVGARVGLFGRLPRSGVVPMLPWPLRVPLGSAGLGRCPSLVVCGWDVLRSAAFVCPPAAASRPAVSSVIFSAVPRSHYSIGALGFGSLLWFYLSHFLHSVYLSV